MFTGQNKNIYIVLMFMYLIQEGTLKEVHLDFMVSGHSFLPCDRGFGRLEKVFKKQEVISCPNEYEYLIRTLTKTSVNNMDHSNLYDFKSLKKLVIHRTAEHPVLFSKATTIVLTYERPVEFEIRSHPGNAWVDLRKRGSKVKLT